MNQIELRNLPSFSFNERKGDHIILAPLRKKADRLKQLATENAKILEKLQTIKPTYNATKWEAERNDQEDKME